jgi:transcriptional regulator with XRE-family HTH domain
MARKKIELDPMAIYDLASQGMTQREMAKELGVSHVTLARRMADIQAKHGILLKYRSIQTLQLTGLQARVLESVTPEKVDSASLLDLVKAFAILKKAELGIKGEPQGTGLVAYLMELERREQDCSLEE